MVSSKEDEAGRIPIDGQPGEFINVRLLYYLAGFTDGEGCFRFSGGTPRCSVTNSFPWPLQGLAMFFGGRVRAKACRDPERHKQVYEWEVSGKSARAFARTIEPYLREKRRQAQLMLRAGKFPAHSEERDECLRALKELKGYEYPL